MLAHPCKTYNPIGRIIALRHANRAAQRSKVDQSAHACLSGNDPSSQFAQSSSTEAIDQLRYGRVYVEAIRGGPSVQVDERGERLAVQMVRPRSKLRAPLLLHCEHI